MTHTTQHRGRSKQDYGTPPELLAAIKARLHIEDFFVDLAASEENKVGLHCYTAEMDSLTKPWPLGWSWLNPPFAKIDPWVEKAARESWKGAHIAMLVPASVGSHWWHDWVEPYAYVSFLKPRLKFVGAKDSYPKDCALLLYTPWGFKGHEIFNWKAKYDYLKGTP